MFVQLCSNHCRVIDSETLQTQVAEIQIKELIRAFDLAGKEAVESYLKVMYLMLLEEERELLAIPMPASVKLAVHSSTTYQ